MMTINRNKDILNVFLAIGIIMGFIFIVSIAIYFIKEHYSLSCSCELSLPLVIATLTSLGIFVGFLTYYFISKSFSEKKEKMIGNIEKTLNFLEKDEKRIVTALIKNKGICHQNKLSKIVGLDSVKIHRRLISLETKKIISKEKSGMTNILYLAEDYRGLFIK